MEVILSWKFWPEKTKLVLESLTGTLLQFHKNIVVYGMVFYIGASDCQSF